MVSVDNLDFFRIRSQTTDNPGFADVVHSEYPKWIIMLSVQQSANIVDRYCGFQFDSFWGRQGVEAWWRNA